MLTQQPWWSKQTLQEIKKNSFFPPHINKILNEINDVLPVDLPMVLGCGLTLSAEVKRRREIISVWFVNVDLQAASVYML